MNNNDSKLNSVTHEHSAVKTQHNIKHSFYSLTNGFNPMPPDGVIYYEKLIDLPTVNYRRKLAIDYIYTKELYIYGDPYNANDCGLLLIDKSTNKLIVGVYEVRLEVGKQTTFPTRFYPEILEANALCRIGVYLKPQGVTLPMGLKGYISVTEERL